MTTTNNPENQNSKPHGLGDQVQITFESPTMGKKNNYSGPENDYREQHHTTPKYVVVRNPGTDSEAVIIDFYTPETAYQYRDDFAADFGGNLDVMKRLDNGTLTTEF